MDTLPLNVPTPSTDSRAMFVAMFVVRNPISGVGSGSYKSKKTRRSDETQDVCLARLDVALFSMQIPSVRSLHSCSIVQWQDH